LFSDTTSITINAMRREIRTTSTAMLILAFAFSMHCACRHAEAEKRSPPAVAGLPSSAAHDAKHVRPEPGRVRKFGEIVGLAVKFSQGQPLSDLTTLSELRVRWVRDWIKWADLEPAPAQFKAFPSAFQKRLDYYRAHDIGLIFLLAYGNAVAYPPTPDAPFKSVDPVLFGRYAAHVARMLKQSGVRFVLEIWNEPHNFGLRPLLGGAPTGEPPSPWVDHYVRMVKETVRQVKAFDPTIRLLTSDDMWVIHYWLIEAGLPNTLDGFAFHPYANTSSVGPEMTAIDARSYWRRPFAMVDSNRSFQSAVRRLRERGRTKLGRTPEMWVTEWGWKIGAETARGPVTEEMVAGFLPRAYIVAEAAGIKALCWFSAQDSVDGPWGLIKNDGKRRKSYFALKTLTEQLADYVFVQQVAGAPRPTSGVQGYLFRGEHDQKLALWNIDAAARRLRLEGALREATAVDTLGAPVQVVRDEVGERYFPIGAAPIYVAGIRGAGPIVLDFASAGGNAE
jgi:hypothetical protein